MSEIKIQNVGPIENLTIPVPDEGGVVVLRGRNGSGKSYALRAVDRLATGGGPPLDLRDGAPASIGGSVEGLGVVIRVGRVTRRKGELEVEALSGRDPSLLVDPRIKDPVAADLRRLAVLCNLAGAKPEIERFEAVLPEGFEVPDHALERETLPEMAAALKAALEVRARAAEGEAETLHTTASGIVHGFEGVDREAEADEGTLAEALERAASALERAEGERRAEALRAKTAADARAALGAVTTEGEVDVPTLEAELVSYGERISALVEQLKRLEAERDRAKDRLDAAKARDSERAAWLASIEEAEKAPPAPSEEDVTALRVARDAARAAINAGAEVRAARAADAEASATRARALALENEAAALRDSARACLSVLGDAVADLTPAGMSMAGDRLVVETERGQTPFSDLSVGQRYRLAIDIAVDAAPDGQRALLAIDQEAWEGLDPANRAAISAHAKARGVVILTAEASGGAAVAAEVEP